MRSMLVGVLWYLSFSAATFAADAPPDIATDANGVVVDHLGKPVSGATVDLVRAQYRPTYGQPRRIDVLASVTSGADGMFHITKSTPPLGDERLCLRGSGKGYGTYTLQIQPNQLPAKRFNDNLRRPTPEKPLIVLAPEMVVHGIVVDQDDQPIADAEVTCLWSRPTVRTDAQGKFTLDSIPDFARTQLADPLSVDISHPDYVPRYLHTDTMDSGVIQLDGTWRIELEKGTLIKGTTTDSATGQPLAGMKVNVICQSPGKGVWSRPVRSNDRGEYQVRVPSGDASFDTYTDSSTPRENLDYLPVETNVQHHLPSDEPLELNFTFRKAQSVTGTIKANLPDQLDRVSVSLSGGVQTLTGTFSPIDGTFVVHNVAPGTYQLLVTDSAVHAELARTDVEVPEGQNPAPLEV